MGTQRDREENAKAPSWYQNRTTWIFTNIQIPRDHSVWEKDDTRTVGINWERGPRELCSWNTQRDHLAHHHRGVMRPDWKRDWAPTLTTEQWAWWDYSKCPTLANHWTELICESPIASNSLVHWERIHNWPVPFTDKKFDNHAKKWTLLSLWLYSVSLNTLQCILVTITHPAETVVSSQLCSN